MPFVFSNARKHLDLIAVNAILLLVTCTIAVSARDMRNNSLAKHPDWRSTKVGLARFVMGAAAYVSDQRPLTRNRLGLGEWFGFQEVMYARALDLKQLDATVRFEPDGYVYVIYDARDDGFSALRLSARRDLPNASLRGSPVGGFTSVTPLTLSASVAANVNHSVRVRFEPDTARVFVDGTPAGSFARRSGPQRIGFRGGQRAVWVDEVTLRLADGSTIRESFANTAHRAVRVLALFGAAGVLLVIVGMGMQQWLSIDVRMIGLWMVLGLVGLATLASGAYAYEFFKPRLYRRADADAKQGESAWLGSVRDKILAQLRRDYPETAGADVYRIVFLGSSQTWGAGATTPDDVWVHQLEGLLNREGLKRRVECVNGGVLGFVSPQVVQMERDLLPLHPQAIVINLSNNDKDTVAFRANLDSMVTMAKQANIAVVLLQEANSPEQRVVDNPNGDLAPKHRVVADVGKAEGVPVIDMHSYLASKNDTGMLWWDFVHLTSYGQRLLAEKLSVDLPVLLHLK